MDFVIFLIILCAIWIHGYILELHLKDILDEMRKIREEKLNTQNSAYLKSSKKKKRLMKKHTNNDFQRKN